MNWLDLFGSREYELPLQVEAGSRFEGGKGFPDAEVIGSEVMYPRRILIQKVDLLARNEDKKQRISVYRVAAEAENGEVIELRRMAMPSQESEPMDTSRCAACGRNIPPPRLVVVDGSAYHDTCVRKNDDSNHNSGRAPGRAPGRSIDRRGDAPSATSVRMDAGQITHLVTVTRLGDEDIVTLWSVLAYGVARGRWHELVAGDVPRPPEVAYLREKFGLGSAASGRDIAIWGRLYGEVVEKLNADQG